MNRSAEQLRADARAIWQAGLDAVRSDRLVRVAVRVESHWLFVDEEPIDLRPVRRILVVGGGKAGAGMTIGLEAALGSEMLRAKGVTGLVNVPADCVLPTANVALHAARPAGVNEPRAEGVAGAEEILRLVSAATADDLCLCLLSGGGSALLPAPAAGVTLADKLAITKHLSASGANIAELNCVRSQISRMKGGGLLRACSAGRLRTLVISDVLGDPLDVIASGPTTPTTSTAADALDVLERFGLAEAERIAPSVVARLRLLARTTNAEQGRAVRSQISGLCDSKTIVIGNNAAAVDAAGIEAERRGYSHAMLSSTVQEPTAEEVGSHLAALAVSMRDERAPHSPDCLITGGEPTVRLAPAEIRGRGGRNQQLVLAAGIELANLNADGIVLLSGGTDGEDGPTDAAGALVDAEIVARSKSLGLDAADYLRRNDAYTFFAAIDGLLKTGPTHTNVCDLRVVVVQRSADRE